MLLNVIFYCIEFLTHAASSHSWCFFSSETFYEFSLFFFFFPQNIFELSLCGLLSSVPLLVKNSFFPQLPNVTVTRMALASYSNPPLWAPAPAAFHFNMLTNQIFQFKSVLEKYTIARVCVCALVAATGTHTVWDQNNFCNLNLRLSLLLLLLLLYFS